MPGASAVSAATTAQEAVDHTAENCPELDSIGAVGDAFCNPFRITDLSLTEEDPGTIVYEVCRQGIDNGFHNFDNDDPDCKGEGNEESGKVPKINTTIGTGPSSSRLMEYIVYCGQRDSPFGMADMNIANSIHTQIGGAWAGHLAVIPFWGGIADILKSRDILNKIGYVTGDNCVAKDEPDGNVYGEDAFTWSEARYYQRFIEDQRYLESAGLVDKSAVTIALEKYYEENPLDQSQEGILARMTGMTKEQVVATEDLLEVMLWVANYNPKNFYPYKYEQPEEEQIAIDDDEIIDLDDYDIVDDGSWKYSFRMEYHIS